MESVEMKGKSREYLRELKDDDIQNLKKEFKSHLKPPRDGFLNKKQKERLLRITKWPRDTSNRNVYDFFYEIRERAESSLNDLKLLCEVLNEKELESIFGNKSMASEDYPITKVLLSLLPESRTFRMKPKEIEKLQKEQEWRKVILNELVLESLYWYFHSGLFETDAHTRLLADTMDAISVLSGGDHKIQTNYEVNLSRLAF